MSTLAFLLDQIVNALSQSALLFFLGVGLTLIFGLMRIVNFAHGALYMLGAFVGYSLGAAGRAASGSRWRCAPVLVGLFGAAFEFSILRRLYRRDAHAFLMVTFGLALVVGEAVRLTWGSDALQVPAAAAAVAAWSSCSTSRSRSIACSSSPPASSWRWRSGSSSSARGSGC